MLLKEKLHESLSNLSTEQKLVIHYRFWEEMSLLEISNCLSLSWDEVDGLLDETLAKLRERLSESHICRLNYQVG